MNRYESVIILSANASEEAMAAFGEKMKELISAAFSKGISSSDHGVFTILGISSSKYPIALLTK